MTHSSELMVNFYEVEVKITVRYHQKKKKIIERKSASIDYVKRRKQVNMKSNPNIVMIS